MQNVSTLKLYRPGLILSQLFSTYVHLLNLFDIFESVSPCVKRRIMRSTPRRIILRVNETIYSKLLTQCLAHNYAFIQHMFIKCL